MGSRSTIARAKATSLALVCMLLNFFCLPTEAKVIMGEIEHKETLPPVPSNMQKGSVFSSPAIQPQVQWFPVPDWLAGTWMKEGDVETFAEDFRTGRHQNMRVWINNRVRLSFGHQVDAQGTIWHAEVVPFRADGQKAGATDERYVMEMSCLNSTPQVVVLRFRSVVSEVEPRSRRVLESKQQEEIVTFEPSAGTTSKIGTKSSIKSFSAFGQPLFQYETQTNRTRIADFVPTATLEGLDLQSSLYQFLEASNMEDRIPAAATQTR